MDLIKREDAIKAVTHSPAIHGSEGAWIDQADVLNRLKDIPAVEPYTENMIVDGEEIEIDPVSYEVGLTKGMMMEREAVEPVCGNCKILEKHHEIMQRAYESGRKSVEPKQGEWIQTSNDWIDGTCGARYYPIHCSICNYPTYDDSATNFCPNCGARMFDKDTDNISVMYYPQVDGITPSVI